VTKELIVFFSKALHLARVVRQYCAKKMKKKRLVTTGEQPYVRPIGKYNIRLICAYINWQRKFQKSRNCFSF